MKKDWTGNTRDIFTIMGARNFTIKERETNDFYATDPQAIDYLLKYETFNNNIWECAVGQGHIAQRLKEYGYNVKCTDIIDRGYEGTKIVDFISEKCTFDGDIITNPPYKYTSEFILKALDSVQSGYKVAMFLKLQTLEGQKRYEQIYSKYPPKTVYVFSKRIKCFMNGIDDGQGSAICYSWFIWTKDDYGHTELKWIN